MYNSIKGLAAIGLVALLSACAGSKVERYIKSDNADLNVRIERGACFGSCPVYNMDITTLSEERTILTFEGIRFVSHSEGMIVTDILPVELDSLKMFLIEGNFFALDSVYDNPDITDLPTTRVEVRWGENLTQKKAVTGRYDTPEGFDKLVRFLERLRLRHL